MNTNSNTYTVIYSIILVVVVAAVLAFTAITLQPLQDTNVKVETISKILSAVGLHDSKSTISNDEIMKTYSENIAEAVLVNSEGEVVGTMNTEISNIEIKGNSDLKAQNDLMKKGDKESIQLPIYIFNVEGKKITAVPCYGAGLWGPVWGYIALEEDMNTVVGATFDHKGETPGLGAEIATDWFCNNFKGKKINNAENQFVSIKVVKGGAAEDDFNGVDAISGGTITSQALEKAIGMWLEAYVPYFSKNAPKHCACCSGHESETNEINAEE